MILSILGFILRFLIGTLAMIGLVAVMELIKRYYIRGVQMQVIVEASNHCCGIYQMQGVRHVDPKTEDIDGIINKTKWDGKTSKIIQFSDVPGGRGESWRKHLIKLGYQVDKFTIGMNPKTGSTLYLYHWYLTPKTREEVAMKLSMTREYTYEQEEQRPDSQQAQPRISAGRRIFRDAFGRFRSSGGL